jgi:hypothetical protein
MNHSSDTCAGYLRAGAARSDITTNAAGAVIRDPLYATALVIDDGKTRLAIVAMDTTAVGGRAVSARILDDVGEEFLPRLRERVEKELNIPGAHVLVNASHTHPSGRLLCDDDAQVERAFDAVARAVQNMTPARVGAGFGSEKRITINRTLRLRNGKHWTIRHSHPSPPDAQVVDVGPTDPQIGIIRIDRLDGTPLAAVYNFACHPGFGDAKGSLTANFPGVASRVIEEQLGHEAMALFLQGAAGDIMDVGYKDFSHPRDIEAMGTTLALSALKAFRKTRTGDATLNVLSETVELPKRTDFLERIAALLREQAELLDSLRSTSLNFKSFLPLYLQYALNPDYPLANSYRYLQADKMGQDDLRPMDALNRRNLDKYLMSIRAMERLAVIQEDISTLRKHQAINEASSAPTITAEIQGLRIGACVLLTAPIELLVEVGLNIKRASPYEYTFIAGFSNGYLHYGPPSDYCDKGGYEATECLLAPGWQRICEEKAADIIRRL